MELLAGLSTGVLIAAGVVGFLLFIAPLAMWLHLSALNNRAEEIRDLLHDIKALMEEETGEEEV